MFDSKPISTNVIGAVADVSRTHRNELFRSRMDGTDIVAIALNAVAAAA